MFFYLYPFLRNTPTGQTACHIYTLNGSNDVDLRKDVALLALVDIAAHLGDQIAQNPNFGGVNRHFPAKRAKYWNAHYKNYCSDHNQILQSDRDPQILTVGGPNMPQTNPRWRTAAILKNRKILISLQPINRFWQSLAYRCVSTLWTQIINKISRFQKIKMAAAAILKIRKIAISSQRNHRFWRNLVQWCVWAL